ncbi:hypothetical protein BDP27DRAFT_1450865 [Rhodocollybia butyracea]|uniref:Uncharacterized protein n=1 Tax=Rhodocollybia butyracea TaxID=206335 RepID=A0A9P5U380_9AGAR|nr:hypothetical protein BDP27DRAFT_1450865 [Rhodocollybia butyracea]
MPLQRPELYVKIPTLDPDLEAQHDAAADEDSQASASPTSTIVGMDAPMLQDPKEMQTAHALALKVRSKLFSDINRLTWQTLVILVSCITFVLGVIFLIDGDIKYGIEQRELDADAPNIPSLQ